MISLFNYDIDFVLQLFYVYVSRQGSFEMNKTTITYTGKIMGKFRENCVFSPKFAYLKKNGKF